MHDEMTTDERRCELLIVDGTVVDGTGSPGFAAADGVTREAAGASARIALLRGPAAIEDAIGRAGRLVHANGRVVAPGFIDLHSHSGLMILAEPRHEPKVRQGVTTEIVGVDGLSYAPMPSKQDLDALIEMNAGLDGRPDALTADWTSVGEYLARLDGNVSVNVGLMIGNSALRIARLGWQNV